MLHSTGERFEVPLTVQYRTPVTLKYRKYYRELNGAAQGGGYRV